MGRASLEKLGELQRAVMDIVWERGQASVHDVRDALNAQKELAYTTILTTLQKLEKAGWLTHRNAGRSYVYLPARSREQAGAGSVKRFLTQVFEGEADAQHDEIRPDDLREIRKMIEEKRKEIKK